MSWSCVPTRKMLWYEPITPQMVPLGLSTLRQASSQARGEGVIGLEAFELVPVIIDRVDQCWVSGVRANSRALEF